MTLDVLIARHVATDKSSAALLAERGSSAEQAVLGQTAPGTLEALSDREVREKLKKPEEITKCTFGHGDVFPGQKVVTFDGPSEIKSVAVLTALYQILSKTDIHGSTLCKDLVAELKRRDCPVEHHGSRVGVLLTVYSRLSGKAPIKVVLSVSECRKLKLDPRGPKNYTRH